MDTAKRLLDVKVDTVVQWNEKWYKSDFKTLEGFCQDKTPREVYQAFKTLATPILSPMRPCLLVNACFRRSGSTNISVMLVTREGIYATPIGPPSILPL